MKTCSQSVKQQSNEKIKTKKCFVISHPKREMLTFLAKLFYVHVLEFLLTFFGLECLTRMLL